MTLPIDEIAPSYVKEKRFDLTLADDTGLPKANQSIVINVAYDRALPEGVVMPLILEVQGPSESSYQRREFLRTAPSSIVVIPREGGLFRVILREFAHNKWFGSVGFTVSGEPLNVRARGQ